MRSLSAHTLFAVWLCLCLPGGAVLAQEAPLPEGAPLPEYARANPLPHGGGDPVFIASTNGLPNILLTGYWPPTNEMLRQFSPNPDQNTNGWVGENWEGRGYNVYAYFPEFPSGLNKGEGDFEVDYQDTSNDWWSLLPQVAPIAIITFSRAGNDIDWELEGGNRTYELSQWSNDYLDPLKPTPELPIATEPPLTERFSSQPIDQIIANVNTSGAAVFAYRTVLDTGRFLSNYIGYHGNWYHDLHADPIDPNWVVTGGHIHVGYAMELADAVLATEVTVRTVIEHVDARRALVAQGDLNGDGYVDLRDYALMQPCLGGPQNLTAPGPCDSVGRFILADLDGDGDVDLQDYGMLMRPIALFAEPVLQLPFTDEFPATQFDPAKWTPETTANIDDVGIAEPSPPYSARFDGSPSGTDRLTSFAIDLSGQTNVHLQYAWQRTGGGNSTETGDDLFVEYEDANGDWQLLQQHLGSGADMTTFQSEDLLLPAAALHSRFRIRFSNTATEGLFDDWFVDDLAIMAE